MQNKYATHFASLSNDEAEYFADAIVGALNLEPKPEQQYNVASARSGGDLYLALVAENIDHKTACMSLATDPSPMAITILEKVVGNKIIKEVPKTAPVGKVQRAKVEGAPKPKLLKNDPRTIHNIKEGAKRPGSASYERYMLYKEGMTVTEFIAAGGTAGDIKHDVSKGFITLKDPE